MAYVVKPIMDGIFIGKNKDMLLMMPLIVILIYLVKGVFRFIQSYFIRYIGQKVIESIRNDLFSKILCLPISYFNNTSTGILMSRVTNDVTLLQTSIPTLINLMRELLTVLGLIIVIVSMDWKLALISLVCYPLFVHPLITMSRKIRRYSRKNQEKMGGLASTLQESFSGIRVVKAFNAEKQELDKFKIINAETVKYELKTIKTAELASPLMEFISSIGFAAIIYFGGLQVINGSSTPGTFFSFMTAVLLVYRPIKTIVNSNNAIQAGLAAAARVFHLMELDDNIKAPEGNMICSAKNKDIVLKDLYFRYDDADTDTLKNINLKVEAGTTIAFIGSSGAGKTTIANLLPRFFDPTSGAIFIGNTNIQDFTIKSLRSEIAVVSQDSFLFDDTIAANISYAKQNTPLDEIKSVARAAFIDEFIETLPDKYDTHIGERGVKLSGGQKQRLTIARALLKNASILILDEATSALDTESERIVQRALENLMQGKTSFVIAHRLSTIIDADQIVVLNNGVVEATGKHAELLQISPTYKKLYDMQFHTS